MLRAFACSAGVTAALVTALPGQAPAQETPPAPQPDLIQPSEGNAGQKSEGAGRSQGGQGQSQDREGGTSRGPAGGAGSGQASSGQVVLGVQLQPGTPQGVPVKAVQLGSAAQAAGLRAGDILVKIDESDITQPRDVTTVLSDYAPGDEVTVTLIRNGKEVITKAVLATAQAPAGAGPGEQGATIERSRRPTLDQPPIRRERVETPPAIQGGWLGIAVSQEQSDLTGLRVKRVYPGGPAARAGIRKDDVLLQVNGRALQEHGNLAEALADTKPGDEIPVVLTRGPNPELNKEERMVRLGDGGQSPRRPIEENDPARDSATYWEDSQGFASDITPASFEIEAQRRLAEQNERLERMIESLRTEISALREEVKSLKQSPSAR